MTPARLVGADCRRVLLGMAADSIDAIATDPPYELGFMGKRWDASGVAFQVDLWEQLLRVLKPGGHLLAFGGTRTYHRMTCAIEDAGFEVRDSLHWLYGTGFPKSLNVGEGRGTALKPGHEPIVLARKPLEGTVAANVAKWGTGALNIDGCRIAGDVPVFARRGDLMTNVYGSGLGGGNRTGETREGRWPANVLLDEGAAAELDVQSGTLTSGTRAAGVRKGIGFGSSATGDGGPAIVGSEGGASRFFYVAKPARAERDAGCAHLPAKSGGEATDREDDSAGTQNPRAGAGRTGGARNFHPTVKPVELMRYLVRLVTPPGGLVLDPFAGSGTTGVACIHEGFGFLGIEREEEYLEIARARLKRAETSCAVQLDLIGATP